MPDFFGDLQLHIFWQLFLAVVLGAFLGMEREASGRAAGIRTYALVALGAALFTIMGVEVFHTYTGASGLSFDPSRIVHAIALGVGFIGGGIIIHRDSHVEGVTTAAGVWMAGAIGVSLGFEFYGTAILATLFAFLVLSWMHPLKRLFRGKNVE